MGKWSITVHVRGLMCTADYTWRKRMKWGLAVPPWGCGWILCILEASWSLSRLPLFWSSVNWRCEECSLFLRALSWSLCCRVQWTLRKHQWIRHHHPSWDKAGWPLLKLQWPKAWTLLLSIPCPTQPLGIYDLKFIGNQTLAWQLQKQWLTLSCF